MGRIQCGTSKDQVSRQCLQSNILREFLANSPMMNVEWLIFILFLFSFIESRQSCLKSQTVSVFKVEFQRNFSVHLYCGIASTIMTVSLRGAFPIQENNCF